MLKKTKVIIFSKGNARKNYTFKIGNNDIEIVNSYKYLGLHFAKSGSFLKTKKHIAEQANKALFSLLRKNKNIISPI